MPPSKTLTPLELQIMNALWDHGPATVSELQPRLPNPLAYTTVMTMLNVLLRKGRVTREPDGRAFRYSPAVSRRRATGSAVEDLVKRMFGGSAEALLLTLVETRGITSDDLARLSKAVAKAEAEQTAAPEKAQPSKPRPRKSSHQEPSR